MTEGSYAARLRGALALAGAASLFLVTVAGWTLALAARAGAAPGLAAAFRTWLATGGWLKAPLWGAALAALIALPRAVTAGERRGTLALALGLAALPLAVHTRELPAGAEPPPRGARATARAILRWSYRTPGTVLEIVGVSRDHDPVLREQAVLALGVNIVVADIEHATVTRPSRFASSPVRDSVRARLIECLGDPVESVRAEAARALWKAPVTFGTSAAAAETLAAILDRAADPGRPERLAWLALDAACGVPNDRLRRAAGRFASATGDTELKRRARLAAGRTP